MTGLGIIYKLGEMAGLSKEEVDAYRSADSLTLGNLLLRDMAEGGPGVSYSEFIVSAYPQSAPIVGSLSRKLDRQAEFSLSGEHLDSNNFKAAITVPEIAGIITPAPTAFSPDPQSYRIRTDLNFYLAVLYEKRFPLFEVCEYVPSNGVLHTYDLLNSTQRANAHIACSVAYRGVGLHKSSSANEVLGTLSSLVGLQIKLSLLGDYVKDPNSFDGLNKLLGLGIDAMVIGSPFDRPDVALNYLKEAFAKQSFGYAYLGAPHPVILELPVGFNNFLSRTFIMFMMNGLILL